MIDTGHTVKLAAEVLKEAGAKDIYVLICHGEWIPSSGGLNMADVGLTPGRTLVGRDDEDVARLAHQKVDRDQLDRPDREGGSDRWQDGHHRHCSPHRREYQADTQRVGRLCLEAGVAQLILLPSRNAVNPSRPCSAPTRFTYDPSPCYTTNQLDKNQHRQQRILDTKSTEHERDSRKHFRKWETMGNSDLAAMSGSLFLSSTLYVLLQPTRPECTSTSEASPVSGLFRCQYT